ncbi:hypothetical protein [Paraburkholderia sp. BCC1886]|uniref:hypothetical protein n=1 Tax=Paraburkholderia sp. BCC1886 TaxID=2562670 RepID=UPI00118317F1|nr:hypothetical protein [Paraburkholderia sp. BCC1886]
MTTDYQPEPFPGSQYNEINPILQAILADIQSRNIKELDPKLTIPTDINPGGAYALSIYERGVHMTLHRLDDTGQLELWFGTGGEQWGPVRWFGDMVAPSDQTALLSLFAVMWLSLTLDVLDLHAWNLKHFNTYYPDVVGKEEYRDILRVLCLRVLRIPEFSFEDGVNVTTDSDESEL